MNRRTLSALIASLASLSVLLTTGCGSKDPNLDPNAPVVLTKSEGPSPVKGSTPPPQGPATAGQIDPDQQKALEMEARSSGNQSTNTGGTGQ